MKPQIINAKMNRLIFRGRLVKAAIFAATIFMVAVMTGSIYLRDRVYITDNGVTKELMTSETDVYAILRMASYQLGTNDKVSYEATSSNTAYITIYRAFDVNVSVDGETRTVSVIDGTVGEILDKAGVTLGEFDEVSCPLTDSVYEGMDIVITRVEYVTRENSSEIAYDTEYIDNTNRAIGTDAVITPGVPGKRVYTVREKYVDGKLTSQELNECHCGKYKRIRYKGLSPRWSREVRRWLFLTPRWRTPTRSHWWTEFRRNTPALSPARRQPTPPAAAPTPPAEERRRSAPAR